MWQIEFFCRVVNCFFVCPIYVVPFLPASCFFETFLLASILSLFPFELFDKALCSYHIFTYLNISTDICEDDWEYFNGYCYRKVSSCDSWSNGQGTCAALGANLPSIHSQEENVFVQSLHGGEHSWLGLSDTKSEGPEGNFVWSDGAPFDFNFWAQHQPKKSHKQNCVHTLGFLQEHLYKWKDVNCTECHRFTCKKGTT